MRQDLENEFETKAYVKAGIINPNYVAKLESHIFTLTNELEEMSGKLDYFFMQSNEEEEAPKLNIYKRILEWIKRK